MARITRKELKSDKFAEDVGLTVTFFEEHQKDVVRYGGIGLGVIVLIAGFFLYRSHEHTARQQALAAAIRVQETPVATVAVNPSIQTFPTQAAKNQAALKAFSDLKSKYSGSEEAQIAEYYMGNVYADQGNLIEAEKSFLDLSDHGDKDYASLGKLSLADIYFADGRAAQGEKLLRDLMDNPTIFVSKDQAAIALARNLTGKNNAEARKLLAPIKDGRSQVASIARGMYSQLPPQ